MREQLKQRLVGAMVLVALGVIVIPEFLEPPEEPIAPLEPRTQTAAGDLVSEVVVVEGHELPTTQADSSRVSRPVAPPPAAVPLAEDSLNSRALQQAHTTAAVDSNVSVPSSRSVPPGSGELSAKATGTWVVLLATFSKKGNANDFQNKLRDMGYAVFLESQPAEKGTWTQVFVGPLGAKDEAQKTLALLEKEFKLKGLVLQR